MYTLQDLAYRYWRLKAQHDLPGLSLATGKHKCSHFRQRHLHIMQGLSRCRTAPR